MHIDCPPPRAPQAKVSQVPRVGEQFTLTSSFLKDKEPSVHHSSPLANSSKSQKKDLRAQRASLLQFLCSRLCTISISKSQERSESLTFEISRRMMVYLLSCMQLHYFSFRISRVLYTFYNLQVEVRATLVCHLAWGREVSLAADGKAILIPGYPIDPLLS